MPENTELFLRSLFGLCQDGCITLTAIHPDGQHPTPSRHIALKDQSGFSVALTDLLNANEQGWGAFFGVATRQKQLGRWRRGGQGDVLALPAVFVDLDVPVAEAIQRLRAHDPPPSCAVASGGGVHAYWWLDTPTSDWVRATQALQHLRQSLGSDRATISQVLRLPGSLNTKPSRCNAPCQLLDLQPVHYPLTAFLDQTRVVNVSAGMKPAAKARLHLSLPNCNIYPRPLNPLLIAAVESALICDYGGFRQCNGWIAALCPCGHRHDRPGMHFAFSPEKGIGVCLGRHGRLKLKDVCRLLGLHPDDYGGVFVSERLAIR